MDSYCVRAFAEALEVIPYTLAENAGLNPIEMVTELRNKHARGETAAGINVRKGQITNMMDENVVQPLLVTTSAITLACECVRMILKVGNPVVCDCKVHLRVASGIFDANCFMHTGDQGNQHRCYVKVKWWLMQSCCQMLQSASIVCTAFSNKADWYMLCP